MSDLDDKLDELEQKISDKRRVNQENHEKRRLEKETEEKRVHEFWIKEFTENQEFKTNIEKVISKFTKINPLINYNYENFMPDKGRHDPYINWFYLKFNLNNSHAELRIFPMTPFRTVVHNHNGSSIDIEVNFDNNHINYLSDEERIKKIGNYQLDKVDEAKKVFFEKILELFEIENKNIY